MMDDEKARAAYHPEEPPAPLPVRDPWASFAQHGAPPDEPVQHAEPGERPWVSPGRPPWDSRIHQELAVQHGWPSRTVDARPNSTVAVWALVTGIVGVLAGWCLLGLPCLAAVVLGHVALSQTKTDQVKGRGLAIAGLVLGYVALIPALIFCLYAVIGLGADPAPAPVGVTPSPWPTIS